MSDSYQKVCLKNVLWFVSRFYACCWQQGTKYPVSDQYLWKSVCRCREVGSHTLFLKAIERRAGVTGKSWSENKLTLTLTRMRWYCGDTTLRHPLEHGWIVIKKLFCRVKVNFFPRSTFFLSPVKRKQLTEKNVEFWHLRDTSDVKLQVMSSRGIDAGE